jgi:hypothetical protein
MQDERVERLRKKGSVDGTLTEKSYEYRSPQYFEADNTQQRLRTQKSATVRSPQQIPNDHKVKEILDQHDARRERELRTLLEKQSNLNYLFELI